MVTGGLNHPLSTQVKSEYGLNYSICEWEEKMSQCEHVFELDPKEHQVKCIKCGDLDDEMQITDKEAQQKEALDEFYQTQETFE